MSRKRLFPSVFLYVLLVSSLAAAQSDGPNTLDREMLRWNEQIPGFGGGFHDELERPNVYLLDPANDAAAREAFGPDVQVLQGQYEFAQLAAWKSELVRVLSLPGIVFLDIDEQRNRIAAGLDVTAEDWPANRERLEIELDESGVPREAVFVEETEPVVPLALLSDGFEHPPGGVQISYNGTRCTLGFNVQLAGAAGFVTASHCSRQSGVTEGTVYGQPDDTRPIGFESFDPPYFNSTTDPACPWGHLCRYSDSLFARYDPSSSGQFGYVARTRFRDRLRGSREIVEPPFYMSTPGLPWVGNVVNKVGRSTGWTYGRITHGCADFNLTGAAGVTFLCQNRVQAGAVSGDSGAPVFLWKENRFFSLSKPAGIVWGGNKASFIYSVTDFLDFELGPLDYQ